MNYANGNRNPLNHVSFYTKDLKSKVDLIIEFEYDQTPSCSNPQVFEEYYLRIYVKKRMHLDSAKHAFQQFIKKIF